MVDEPEEISKMLLLAAPEPSLIAPATSSLPLGETVISPEVLEIVGVPVKVRLPAMSSLALGVVVPIPMLVVSS